VKRQQGARAENPVHGAVQKYNPGGAAICYLLRWRWANSPLALSSKHPITPSLRIYLLLTPPA
jgi:hypothetical protein